MASFKYTCSGCEKEISDGDCYPQGTGQHRKMYCVDCNKRWVAYEREISIRLREVDDIRAKIKDEVRRQIFMGEKAEANPKSDSPVGNAMRASLSAGDAPEVKDK